MDSQTPQPEEKKKPRKKILLLAILILLVCIAGITFWLVHRVAAPKTTKPQAQAPLNAPNVQLSLYAADVPNPVGIISTGQSNDSRLFVLDQNGFIRIVNKGGRVVSEPFLDISSKVLLGNEMGLLGMAFSPQYAKDGYFYINYIDKTQSTVIARYHVSTDANKADPASSQAVLTLKQPYSNHNGGTLLFGPDGYLYAALGDGGSGGDLEDRAQNLNTLFGKILRLDVSTLPYKIPATNPFANQAGKAGEIWDYGLRNPWKISFDRKTQDLYIADVGQLKIEEINVEPAGSKGGHNYGWRCYEGNQDYNLSGCTPKDQHVLPVLEYEHTNDRCSVTGGYVYRGHTYPALDGKYFYGDYCTGELFMAQKTGTTWHSSLAIHSLYKISTFGEDSQGELYMADIENASIYKLEDAANPAR